MNEEQTGNNTNNTILRELSDIKSSLAVNTNETANIKASISEIKVDIKEIKNDFVNRREFTDSLIEIRKEISPIKKIVYTIGMAIIIAVIGALLKLIIK